MNAGNDQSIGKGVMGYVFFPLYFLMISYWFHSLALLLLIIFAKASNRYGLSFWLNLFLVFAFVTHPTPTLSHARYH